MLLLQDHFLYSWMGRISHYHCPLEQYIKQLMVYIFTAAARQLSMLSQKSLSVDLVKDGLGLLLVQFIQDTLYKLSWEAPFTIKMSVQGMSKLFANYNRLDKNFSGGFY